MKLLFDQNISFRIIKKAEVLFPDSKQVRLLGLENSSDIDIWNYAKNNKYTIVTFDADFADIASIKGSPPKIIWLRTGNLTTKNILQLLKNHHKTILEFIEYDDYKEIDCLEID